MVEPPPITTPDQDVLEITARILGQKPRHAKRLALTQSGNRIFAVQLADGAPVVIRISPRPRTFTYTAGNITILRRLGLPVPTVLAAGPASAGGSFIMLNWLPGRDLVHELPSMSPAQMTSLAQTIVTCSRRIMELPPAKKFGPAPIGMNGHLARWTDLFGPSAPDVADQDATPLGILRRRLRSLRAALEPYFATITPRCFLDDLTLKNVLVHQGRLSGIIDLDFVYYGDPLLAVGATLAESARDFSGREMFYGQELVRCWHPDENQHRAIWFYAALFACGFLSASDTAGPAAAPRLHAAAEEWLTLAQPAPARSV